MFVRSHRVSGQFMQFGTTMQLYTCRHFSLAANDRKLDSKEQTQYKGLASKLSSGVFVTNLAMMLDALEELLKVLLESLQSSSLQLQKIVI